MLAESRKKYYICIGKQEKTTIKTLTTTTHATDTKKMIVASCNPYNARTHYNGERVLEYDMTTPVKWVINDGYGCGLTDDEAHKEMENYANAYESASYYDEESLADYENEVKEMYEYENDAPYEGDIDTSWFMGAGYYENEYPIYLIGDDYYREDVMTYAIVDFVAEEEEDE